MWMENEVENYQHSFSEINNAKNRNEIGKFSVGGKMQWKKTMVSDDQKLTLGNESGFYG